MAAIQYSHKKNMVATRALLFLGLLALASATGWKGTRIIYASAQPATKALSLVNIDTGVAHLFTVAGDQIIHRGYRASFTRTTTISTGRIVKFIDAGHSKHTAALSEEGEQVLLLAFESTRSGQTSAVCAKDDTSGCSEVYLISSTDDGKTWGKPQVVKRKDSNDAVHRKKPSVTYDREHDVIYVGYTRVDAATNGTRIAMVREYVSDQQFREEEILNVGGRVAYRKILDPKLAVTNPGKAKASIHMSFIGELNYKENSVLLYTRSEDNGTTWSVPVDISPEDHLAPHNRAIASIGIAGQEDVFMLYSAKGGAEIRFITSRDSGKSWSQPKVVSSRPGQIPYLRVCGQTKALGAILVLTDGIRKIQWEVQYFNRTDGTYTTLPTPFKDRRVLGNVVMADCYALVDPDIKIVAVTTVRTTSLLDDYNYDLPPVSEHA